jgi:hypothetical protein
VSGKAFVGFKAAVGSQLMDMQLQPQCSALHNMEQQHACITWHGMAWYLRM